MKCSKFCSASIKKKKINRLFFFFWYRRFTFQFTFAVYLSSQFPLLLFLLLYIK